MSNQPLAKPIELPIVGSTKYGRYSKISNEQTYNMIISDGFLVPQAGYANALTLGEDMTGRGLYVSYPKNIMISVMDNDVFRINSNLSKTLVGHLNTYSGNVSIDGNDSAEIAIADGKDIHVYNYNTGAFTKAQAYDGALYYPLDFLPNYVTFQDGYMVAGCEGTNSFRLSALNNAKSFPSTAGYVGSFQTNKQDLVKAVVAVPGRGSLLLVIGSLTSCIYFNTGVSTFPYQMSTAINIDFGCVNSATIAKADKIVAWIGRNEYSTPQIVYTTGEGDLNHVSIDGIDYELSQIDDFEKCYGLIYSQDGHLIYQATFTSALDDFSVCYDFNTKLLFTPSDVRMGAHIAKRGVTFNNTYYFISHIDGKLYEWNSKYTTFDGKTIPRIRVLPTSRFPDGNPFIVKEITCLMEQGMAEGNSYLDLTLSKDGGETFGNAFRHDLNTIGNRMNKICFENLGFMNEVTPQFRWWSQGRVVIGNGIMSIYR
jgi:hypothetical protein